MAIFSVFFSFLDHSVEEGSLWLCDAKTKYPNQSGTITKMLYTVEARMICCGDGRGGRMGGRRKMGVGENGMLLIKKM